jgi:uncharacterized membrane protein YeaQ/YmgE (transglycosylase-associated protein family)
VSFDITLGEAVVWVVIGLLAGSLAGMIATRQKDGFGKAWNLLFGLIGAFIGGAIFDALDINLGLGELTLDLNKLAAACVGAVIVVFGAVFLNSRRDKSKK